jgi:hypothetical protein
MTTSLTLYDRVLGALISAHLLMMDPEQPFGSLRPSWYDGELLQLAHDLASRLLPAFEGSSTGIPYPRVSCLLFLNILTLCYVFATNSRCYLNLLFRWVAPVSIMKESENVLKLATFLSSYTYCHMMVFLHWILINN